MERVVRVELEVVWVICDRKQEERYSCRYIYIYIFMRKRKLGRDHDVMECRRVLTRGTATRRLHTNCLVIKGRLRKINSKRGEEIFVVTGSGNRPVSRGYRSSLSRAFVISIRPKRILPRPLSNPFFFLSLSLFFYSLIHSARLDYTILTPISPVPDRSVSRNLAPPGTES